MGIETVRRNERWKALAAVSDNIAVAFMIAGGAVWYDKRVINEDVVLAVVGAVASLVLAWYLRKKIELEN